MTNNQKLPVWRSILSCILIVAFVLSSLVTIATVLLQNFVLSPAYYAMHVVDDTYVSEMKHMIDDALAIDCVVYTFPYDEIRDAITTENIQKISKEYVFDIVYTMINRTEMPEVSYPMQEITKLVEHYAKTAEDPGLFASADNCVLLVEKLAERINGMLRVLARQTVLDKLSTYVYGNRLVLRCSALWPLFLILTVALGVLLVLFGTNWIYKSLYTTAASFWVSATLCFIPVMLLKQYNIANRIALSTSPLKLFATSALTALMDAFFSFTGILFIVACLFLIISAYFYAGNLRARPKEKKQEAESEE